VSIEKTIAAALEPVVKELVGALKRIGLLEARQPEKGEKGDRGEQGIPGINGVDGQSVKGEKGDQGDPGTPGAPGERGEPGLGQIGPDGAPGPKGERGEQGIQGLKGDAGPVGDDGAKGDKGDRGEDGVSIVSVALGTNDFDLIFSNGEKVTIALPPGIKGDTGDQGIQGECGETGPQGIAGNKGDRGENGIGISATLWEPGVYREGAVVQCDHGRYYLAVCDTAGVPGEDKDGWIRIGKSGFRWRGLKKDGVHYEHGDLFIDAGSTFIQVEDKARMFAQRGKDGLNGIDGTNGKDGASVTEMAITQDGELLLTRDDGEVFVADLRPMLTPVIEKMVQEHLQTLGAIVGA